MALSLDDALRAAHRCFDEAKIAGVAIAVAICEPTGRIKLFMKMDGATDVIAGHEAMRRAIRAAVTNAPSDAAGSFASGSSFVEAEGIGGSTRPGGLACSRKGETFGSVGVAGADDDTCVRCARAGVAAIGGGAA